MLRREWACHARALLRVLESSPGVTDGNFGMITPHITSLQSFTLHVLVKLQVYSICSQMIFVD